VTGSGEVLLDVDGGMAVVTLNAPGRRNSLTPAMAAELIATFDEVDGRSDLGALVIKATGKSFCAGGDIATLTSASQDPAAHEAYEAMGTIYDSFYRLGQVRVPTIAAVRGSAVGAGMNMLLAADLRIVADDARLLWLPQARRHAPGRWALRDPFAADRP
jgi:enoyl-CoA hydratase/carnithine racemase